MSDDPQPLGYAGPATPRRPRKVMPWYAPIAFGLAGGLVLSPVLIITAYLFREPFAPLLFPYLFAWQEVFGTQTGIAWIWLVQYPAYGIHLGAGIGTGSAGRSAARIGGVHLFGVILWFLAAIAGSR